MNKSLLYHFFELSLDDHLVALRKYLLFENGDFSQTFVDHLCDRVFNINANSGRAVSSGSSFVLGPLHVNEALTKAIEQVKNCTYVERLSVRINRHKAEQLSSTLNMAGNSSGSNSQHSSSSHLSQLACIELKYNIDWPLNLVVSEACLKSYNQIFGFLLQIKFVIAALNNVWHVLKRYSKKTLVIQLLFYIVL